MRTPWFCRELADENRDHAGFTVGILARAVDVAVAQRGEIEPAFVAEKT